MLASLSPKGVVGSSHTPGAFHAIKEVAIFSGIPIPGSSPINPVAPNPYPKKDEIPCKDNADHDGGCGAAATWRLHGRLRVHHPRTAKRPVYRPTTHRLQVNHILDFCRSDRDD